MQKFYFKCFISILIHFLLLTGCGTSQCEFANSSDTETQEIDDTSTNDTLTDVIDADFYIQNVCGGDELLFAEPGDSCGSCSRTRWQCEETNLVCFGNCDCEIDSDCAGNEWCSNNICVDETWAYIPAGTFIMGALEDEIGSRSYTYNYIEPRQVTLTRPFLMSRYELTIDEYLEVEETFPEYVHQILSEECNPYPLDEIYWYDAVEYMNARSEQEGLEPCYISDTIFDEKIIRWNRNCLGYRLPTEAEWEYAARAETTTATYRGDLRIVENELLSPMAGYAWCFEEDPLPERACSISSEFGEDPTFLTPHLPGLLPPNPWGLYDIFGNVREIVWDDFMPYGATIDPPSYNAVRAGIKSSRGGSVNSERISDSDGDYCRSACRYAVYTTPQPSRSGAGMRLVRSLPVLRENE